MDLIDRLKMKDEQALKDLMDQYRPFIRYLIRPILHNEQDTYECENDIFLKVWNSIDEFHQEKGNFSGWIGVIARNTAISRVRKKKIAVIPLDEALACGNDESIRERISELETAVGSLRSAERELFCRRYYLEQDLDTIARETGSSVRGIEGRLYRLRKKLRKKVYENE